jgi:phosphate transport system substrate-binding protein
MRGRIRPIDASLFFLASLVMLAVVQPARAQKAQNRILIDGSTGTAPLVQALGKAFTATSGTAIEIGGGLGTRARLDALAGGKIDIAMASHGLKTDEVVKRGMTVHPIAKTAVVFAAHEVAKVASVTEAQVCAIYEGKHVDWKELGGAALAITAHVRPDTEVDVEVIRDGIACLKAMTFPAAVKVMAKSGDMARALAATPGSFGVTSATVVEQAKGRLKALALGGVEPTEANVSSGRYRLTRDAFLVVRNDASPQVKSFIEFVRSAEGAAIIRVNGAVAAR